MGWSKIEFVIKLIWKVWCFEDEDGNLTGTTSETKHENPTLLSSQEKLSAQGHHIPHVQLSSITRLTAYTSVLINTVHPQCIACNYTRRGTSNHTHIMRNGFSALRQGKWHVIRYLTSAVLIRKTEAPPIWGRASGLEINDLNRRRLFVWQE